MSRRLGPFELCVRIAEESVEHSSVIENAIGSAFSGASGLGNASAFGVMSSVSATRSGSKHTSTSSASYCACSKTPERKAEAKVIYLFGKPPKSVPVPAAPEVNSAHSETTGDTEYEIPERQYDCSNYSTCLGLAAALDWNSFSCTSCSGSVNEKLLWRAHQKVRENKALQRVCNLPVLR